MTAIPYYPDVPSPTNRDSTASAIFNLYDYSTRESVTEASNKDQTYGVQSGLCGSQERNALQEHDAEQMEELQSPQIAEGPTYKTRSRTSSRRSRRASSIVQALNGLSQGDWKDSDAANGASSTAPSYVVLAAPVAGHPAVATDGPGEHARYNGEAADDKLHISTPNEVSGRPSSVQSVLSRHSQHSLHIFEPSTQPISDNGTRTQPPDQGYMARTGELQPTDLFQSAQEQEPSRPSTSLANFTSTRQPGEEEDAYHVRATYARLEVQGVFGDGWEEGIERTRERAVVSKRRGSRAPLARSDILVEEERKALAKVDRYGFFDQALKTRQENRVYRIPAQVYRKIPKVPRGPPKRTKAERGGADMMAGGSEDTTGAVPQSISPQEIERLDVSRGEMFRQKEAERVGKWERMLLVADRDPGGNAVKWKWEDGGKGAKLRERVYKGIPDRWRSAAWTALTDAKPRGIQSRSGPQPDVGQLLEKYRVVNARFSMFYIASPHIARNADTVKGWGLLPPHFCATLNQL
ncbi:hypothetical protein QFC21_000836 [Naganishia friedmannii]|uniref:Uncharacterized protein n=1 Tax=Naganishia friedmannii TaxID=89922 RepID=A0ACC2W8K4_9TREE|nr:hypothetical protein QFC21_000836 [Naganishia friedmannii]